MDGWTIGKEKNNIIRLWHECGRTERRLYWRDGPWAAKKIRNGTWKCIWCDTSPPKEMVAAALLCRCIPINYKNYAYAETNSTGPR